MKNKRRAYRFGLWGETAAIAFLRLKCYRIIGQRVRNYAGEIDLIAKRGNTLVFIEVKSRKNAASALEALTPYQQQRIARAASLFLARHPRYASFHIRFDLILIYPFSLPGHIKGVWEG